MQLIYFLLQQCRQITFHHFIIDSLTENQYFFNVGVAPLKFFRYSEQNLTHILNLTNIININFLLRTILS